MYIIMINNNFDLKLLDKLNFNPNINLSDAINSIKKNNIDLDKIPLRLLAKISLSEISFFNNFTIDEIFIYIITFLNIIVIVFSNKYILENKILNLSDKTKENIININKNIKIILGIILVIVSIYMLKMLFITKDYIIVNRTIYMFIYLITAIRILLTSTNLNKYIRDIFNNMIIFLY